MTRFREVFTSRHVVFPVIHVESGAQALRNAQIAHEAQADGVFLINHGMSYERLLEIHRAVADKFPDWWIGVNCLDLTPEEVFGRVSRSISGVWTDNAHIDEDAATQSAAAHIQAARHQAAWPGLYYGGVAFKYQRPVEDLARAAAIASQYMDVVTTSGPGTGEAAAPDKIRVMKQAIGEHPLAIASGITPENVSDYLDSADCFLVATGISKSFEELDSARTRLLVDLVRERET